MSDDFSRKRQRSDEPEGDEYYDPRARAEQEDELPPHLQGQEPIESIDDSLPPHAVGGDVTGASAPVGNEPVGQPYGQPYGQTQQQYGGDSGYGGYGGGGRKRQRYGAISGGIRSAVELCGNLQTLGEFPYEMKILISQSSETISYLWKDYEFSSSIIKFLGANFYEMPHKSVLLSGMISLANAKNENVGRDFISWLKERIEEVFQAIEVDGDDGFEIDGEMGHGKSWNRVILFLRALALFVNLLADPEEILKVFEKLLDYSIEMQSGSDDRNALAEYLYFETILSIPYLLVNDLENREEMTVKLKELIVKKGGEFPVRDTSAEDFKYKPYSDDGDAKTCVPMRTVVSKVAQVTADYLDDMTLFYNVREVVDPFIETVLKERGIKEAKMRADEEKEEGVQVENDESNEDKEVLPLTMPKHKLGEFNVPSLDKIEKYSNMEKFTSSCDRLWKTPRFLIHIFPHEEARKELDFKTVPPVDSFVSILLNDIMNNVLFNVEFNRVTASKQLMNLQLYFNDKIFAKANSPLDKLMIINDLNSGIDFDLVKNLEESTDFEETIKLQMIDSARRIQYEHEKGYRGTWKIEEMFLENLIGHIFKIPKSEVPLVFFETLVADTCGRNWTYTRRENSHEILLFSKLVGDCFKYFYSKIDNFEFESLVRFINWFLTQISHFKFEWRWEDWVEDVLQVGEDKIYNPKVFFVKNVIHKETLVTNYKFIKNVTLPQEFKKFTNISLKRKSELEKYDCKFFGMKFAEENTTDAIEKVDEVLDDNVEKLRVEELKNNYGEVDLNEAIETNTDTFNLFSHYLFNHEDHPYHDTCRDIYMNLENVEESVESLIELTAMLRNRIENGSGNGEDDLQIENADEYIVAVVVQSICLIGSRSFSVFDESLQKVFGDKLKSVLESIDNDLKEEWIIDAVMRIWNNEPRIGLMFVDRLSKYGVIEENTIIKAVWNACEDKIMPLAEIYADEFLMRILDDYDDDDEEEDDEEQNRQRAAVKYYFEMAIEKLNVLCHAAEAAGEEVSSTSLAALTSTTGSETLWAVRALHGLLESRVRKYGRLFAAGELGELLSTSVAHAGLRDALAAVL